MKRKITLLIVVLAVIVLLAIVAFLKQDNSKTEEPQFTTPAATFPATEGAELGVYKVTISAQGFDPKEIVIRKGSFAQLDITNTNQYPVDIEASVIGLYIPSIAPSERASVSFDASKAGNFEIVCQKSCPSGVKLLGKLLIQ